MGLLGLLAAAGLVLAACGAVSSSAAPDAKGSSADATRSPTSSSSSSLGPVADSGSAVSACSGSHLNIGIVNAGGIGPNVGMRIRFTNTGSSTCELAGYPVVVGVKATGSSTVASHIQSTMFGPAVGKVTDVAIPPDGRAEAEIGGADNPTGHEHSTCPTPYRWFRVAPPGGGPSTTVTGWVHNLDSYFPSCGTIGVSRVVLPSAFANFPPPPNYHWK